MTNESWAKIAFYIVAHADDFQIFMYPNIYNDLVTCNIKVVILVTTAGDAGFDEMYWASREEGCKSSVRFCLAPLKSLQESVVNKRFITHNITKWTTNNTSFYFLRLPDGNLDGSGFLRHSNQSLSKLRDGKISSIAAVDNSETYNSWSDFYSTLQTIIQYESGENQDVCINYLNPDTLENPSDHADHISTGQAVQDMPISHTLKQNLFTGYSICPGKAPLTSNDLFWKIGMIAAYEKAVFDASGYSTLKENVDTYIQWSLSKARLFTTLP